MALYRIPKSPFFHYRFQIGGRQFRGTTGTANERKALEVEAQRKREAEAFVAAAQASAHMASGEVPMSLDVACALYFEQVGQHLAAPDTQFHNLGRVIEHFGKDTLLRDITDTKVAAWVAGRRQEFCRNRKKKVLVAPATVNRTTIDVMRKLFTRAKRFWKQHLPDEPMWQKHKLKERGEQVFALRPSLEDKVETALPPGYRDVWRFSLASGLRMANCFLRWSEVNWDDREITVIQKGGRPHTIPISSEMAEILEAQRGRHDEWVFAAPARRSLKGRKAGVLYPIEYQAMKTEWRRCVRTTMPQAGRFHDMRHTAATRIVRATGNLKAAQKLLGHADIATTARYYAHVEMDDVREAMERARVSKTHKPDS